MKYFVASTIVGALLLTAGAQAATITVSVDGRSSPWVQAVNPAYTFGDGSGLAPTVVSAGFDFTAGGSFTITYLSGLTSPYGGGTPPYADGMGDTTYVANGSAGSSGFGFPSQYMVYPPDIYLNELVGTFADASGMIVGTPFAIGNGATVTAPGGASELLLGFNDDIFNDNSGALKVSVTGPGMSAVPLPASAPMFGAALVALGVVGYGLKRRATTAEG